MTVLRRLLGPAKGLIALATALGSVTVLAGVGLMATSAYLISRAGERPASLLLLLAPIAGVRFFSLLRAGARYLERLATHDATFRILAGLKVAVFARLERTLPAAILTTASGDWLRRLSADVDRLERLFSDGVAPVLVLLAVIGGVALGLIPFGHGLAWAAVAGLATVGVAVPLLGQQLQGRATLRLAEGEARLATQLVDAVEGLTDLLMTGQAAAAAARLAADQDALLDRQEQLDRVGAATQGLVVLLAGLTGWAVLALATGAVRQGDLPGPELAMVALGVIAAFEAARPLAETFHTLGESLAAGRRVLPEDAPPTLPADAPALHLAPRGSGLSIRDLVVGYGEGAPPVLRGISFDLPEGVHAAVMGPSGSGKSSLAYALAGLLPPASGRILLGGVDVAALTEEELRRRIAVVEQRPHLFATTVGDNLRLGRPSATPEEQAFALRVVDLEERLATWPGGLEAPVGARGVSLSGGERRRLALARVVLSGAPVWILDEPLASLDEGTARRVAHRLREAARGRTVLWITHDPVPGWAFDAVWRLDEGRLAPLPPETARAS